MPADKRSIIQYGLVVCSSGIIIRRVYRSCSGQCLSGHALTAWSQEEGSKTLLMQSALFSNRDGMVTTSPDGSLISVSPFRVYTQPAGPSGFLSVSRRGIAYPFFKRSISLWDIRNDELLFVRVIHSGVWRICREFAPVLSLLVVIFNLVCSFLQSVHGEGCRRILFPVYHGCPLCNSRFIVA